MHHRKVLFLAIVFSGLIPFSISAEKFKIDEINLESKGKTKSEFLIEKIPPVNKTVVFESLDDLESYLNEIRQNLENTKLLEGLEFTYETSGIQNGISLVKAEYSFYDSTSLLILPKPSYDSNKGAELEIALKDNNFLGFTNTLSSGLTLNFGDEDEPERFSKFTPGFKFDYSLPFRISKSKNQFLTSLDFHWCVEKTLPYFTYTTGAVFGIPFGKDNQNEIDFTFKQSIIRDTDYCKYNDEFYFVEYGEVAVPLAIADIDLSTKLYYRPVISINHNWDKDGISELNLDLRQTPLLKPGNELYAQRIDWTNDNNFRNGYSFLLGTYLGLDLHRKKHEDVLVPSIEAALKLYKAFEHAAINTSIQILASHNYRYNIGKFIRGALDKSEFSDGIIVDDRNYAFVTPSALILNLDFPFHIVSTDWVRFFNQAGMKNEKLLSMMNFEMQLGPFIDVALIDNRGTENKFSLKEGIYTSGIELLVYPTKWKSFVIRGSLGFDISKKFLDGKYGFDSSWRDGKDWECYIGLGLHF